MNAFSSTIEWLRIEVLVEVPAVRWPLLVLLAGIALLCCGLLLARRTEGWLALFGAFCVTASVFTAIMLEIPDSDVLAVVSDAKFAAGLLIASRALGVIAAAAGLLLSIIVLAVRRGPATVYQALGGLLSFIIGILVVWVESPPIEQLKRDMHSVGPLPGPTFLGIANAHVGLAVERTPSVVHRALQDDGPAFYNPAWQLDRPVRIVPREARAATVTVQYSLGPVRLTVPILTDGVEDRGPRAWPLAVGDELRLGATSTTPPAAATKIYRVLRSEIKNGFKVFVMEVSGESGAAETEYLVRKGGALHRALIDRTDSNGNLEFVLREFLSEPQPGKCDFDGLSCVCSPKLSTCSWRSEGTTAGQVGALLLGISTLGITGLMDLPFGKTTSGELFVLSHTGPGVP